MRTRYATLKEFPGYRFDSDGNVYKSAGESWMRLEPYNRVRGYLGVTVHDSRGVRRPIFVHRLILMAFNGPPPTEKHESLHLNGIRQDNRLVNLKWGLHWENMLMDRGNGHAHKGEANKNVKLSPADVVEIRRIYEQRSSDKWGRRRLARRLGVSEQQIYIIATRKPGGWTHV